MSSPASRWISMLEYDLLNDHQHPESAFYLWSDPSPANEAVKGNSFNHQLQSGTCSTDNENSKGDSSSQENRKRARDDGAQGKASREKMRRDRMNDRFVELSAVLEPDKLPKTDKASILRDAARIIIQLRTEAQQTKEANGQLQETIKELKAEKNELREEKLSLKMEKERLEKRLKSVEVLPSYTAHATVHAAAGTSYTQQSHTLFKPTVYPDLPFSATMSQWIPPEVADVSNDHVLRPPVA